jgi:NAD(P)-dependent dehydrogenase (short-subunit alcohol dehydrogenase family)
MPDGELSGKTAIVTGGGRGLGRTMALGLARAGANVVITAARGRHEIEAVASEATKISHTGIVHGVTADVTNEEDDLLVVSEAIREFGAIHILVNKRRPRDAFHQREFPRHSHEVLADRSCSMADDN